MKNYKKYLYADISWSPFSGCSAGCSYCWARPFAHRLKKMGVPAYQYDNPFTPRFHPERLSAPSKWRKPQIVACNFMGDWMDAGHTNRDRNEVWRTMFNNNKHTYLTLTKQPKTLLEFTKGMARAKGNWPIEEIWPDWVYNGYSPTCQKDLDDNMADFLQVPGKKWLSIEPMTGPIDLNFRSCLACGWIPLEGMRDYLESHGNTSKCIRCEGWLPGIDQVIVGGMSGPKATPLHPDWVRKVRDDCLAAGVPFFFKQWGEWGPRGRWLTIKQSELKHMPKYLWVDADGKATHHTEKMPTYLMYKFGKKAAGRLLDGREHNDLAWGE